MRFVGVILFLLVAAVAGAQEAEDVAGFGPTVDDAGQHARQKALKILKERLAEHDPPLTSWDPTLRDIEVMLVDPRGRTGQSEHVEPVGLQHQLILSVNLPSDEEMVRRNRQALRGKAMVWALLAISVVLVGVALWKRK